MCVLEKNVHLNAITEHAICDIQFKYELKMLKCKCFQHIFGIDLQIRNVSIFLCRFNWHVYYVQVHAHLFRLPEVSLRACIAPYLPDSRNYAHVKTEIKLG